MSFSSEEFNFLSQTLEQNHAIFSQLWRLGKPGFTTAIDTAHVVFDSDGGCINFEVNYDFWKDKSLQEKCFIISHECLHVLLDHGSRLTQMVDQKISGIAVDLVVNQMLINNFGFKKEEVDPNNKYYWIDSIFPAGTPTNRSAEFYYKELEVLQQQNPGILGKSVVDDHKNLPSDIVSFLKEDMPLHEALDNLSDQEKESLSNLISNQFDNKNQMAGTVAAGILKVLNISKVAKKRKWETVIKNWAKTAIKYKEEDQWQMPNRRYSFLSQDLILPSEAELEIPKKDRVKVWFFQDTSGSCAHLAERFFKAALSLPEDKFDVRAFCFDVRIYPIDLKKPQVKGFGGTSFTCISNYINRTIEAEGCKHPGAVMIITDGAGDYVNPTYPEKWYWFLSTSYKNYIPQTSHIYQLSNFE